MEFLENHYICRYYQRGGETMSKLCHRQKICLQIRHFTLYECHVYVSDRVTHYLWDASYIWLGKLGNILTYLALN